MRAKIVLARPMYEENIGLIARAMANFGCSELALVQPQCEWKSEKAKSRAMHGKGILQKAKKFGSIKEACADCSCAIATTAKAGGGKIGRTAVTARKFAEKFAGSSQKIALVFGSEPDGLSNSEAGECDFVATIPASPEYKTLNISHAAT
ncbi:MAG: RNA methyltransferase, partial [Candidatus Diapherotrites archaeon]|nr:RNA methyltransferase [Candidatus Diapherotrites archaeon]